MSPSAARTSHRCFPRTFVGKNGLPVEIHRLPADAGQRLIDMYLAFQPRNSFQGLPPIKDEVCVRWVREILVTGIHVTAMPSRGTVPIFVSAKMELSPLAMEEEAGETPALRETEQPIIGHAAIFPVNPQKCEMLVVVCHGFQDLGIGTELVRSCIDLAGELGFERIWLPVDATNVRARHVYRKCGFEYVSNKQGRELDMTCEVHSARSATIGDPVAVPFGECGDSSPLSAERSEPPDNAAAQIKSGDESPHCKDTKRAPRPKYFAAPRMTNSLPAREQLPS